jgi:hypothetical protein
MSSEVKANKISPATGTALQISDSGDTTTIPSGATLAIASGATIANSGTQTGFGLFSSYAIIADQKASGTAGGTCTTGAWRTRDLQTEIADPDGIVSISANAFTLGAGTYFIMWTVPGFYIYRNQSRLYNLTDTSAVEVGSCDFCNNSFTTTRGLGSARVTIAGSKAFTIEHRSSATRTTDGFGLTADFDTEQYTTVEIFKEA